MRWRQGIRDGGIRALRVVNIMQRWLGRIEKFALSPHVYFIILLCERVLVCNLHIKYVRARPYHIVWYYPRICPAKELWANERLEVLRHRLINNNNNNKHYGKTNQHPLYTRSC